MTPKILMSGMNEWNECGNNNNQYCSFKWMFCCCCCYCNYAIVSHYDDRRCDWRNWFLCCSLFGLGLISFSEGKDVPHLN